MGCFCFGEEGPKVQVGSRGEEIYRYPSGNVAAVIQGGSMSSFYEDSNRRRLLCWFTSQGEGKIYYETGQVRVSMTKTDCTFFAPDGHVARKWTWPRLLKQPEEIRLGERINVTLIDGDNIVTKLKLQKNGRITEFESGRAARR